ncbi:MAG TPA: pilus assembly protein PilM [Spirochaetota bacterium]|nr:pilus assembly protein PilM [Spirochaetota bacterium]HPS85403.1 pilus assembly protein PilM [Spirochaetota bacterium]
MFDNIASIDIGSSSIKLIKAKRGLKKFELISAVIEIIDRELLHSDYTTAVENALHNILEKENLSEFKIVTSMPAERILLRNITFPFNDITKITHAIPYEAEENIPYPLDMVTFDFQTIPSENMDSRSVILAAVNKDYLISIIETFKKSGLNPVFSGIEANSILRCYEYFNSVNDETVLQIDIGDIKTVVNIVRDSSLLYTRSIPSGLGRLIEKISRILNISLNEAQRVLESLDLDLTSFDSNLKINNFKNLNISKPKLKLIFQEASQLVADIMSDIAFTIKASGEYTDYSRFSRIIITGGGSNLKGVSKIISDESGLPVVFMPFLNGYPDADIRSRFSVCLGNLLVYMNNRNTSINFLKGDFTPDSGPGSLKKFYLPLFFVSLTILFLLINFSSTIYFVVKSNNYTETIMQQKFKKYFNVQTVPKDPVKEANIILSNEKKELSVLKELLGEETLFIPTLNLVIKNFSGAEGFDIKKINYDGKSMVIEGEIRRSGDLEDFKKNLLNSGEFESVTINIRDTSSTRSLFTISIKQKI